VRKDAPVHQCQGSNEKRRKRGERGRNGVRAGLCRSGEAKGAMANAERPEGEARARRRGRRWAFGLFYSLAVLFTAVLSVQVAWQVWAPSRAPGAPPGCTEGLRSLLEGLDGARAAAEGSDVTPEQALRQFRASLGEAWGARDTVSEACRGEARWREAFDLVERLRYAEESAVRRDARDLGLLRRRVGSLRRGPLGTKP
jgi:hypothetical protein